MSHFFYNRVSICTVSLNAQVEPVAFPSFIGTGDYSCPAMFSLKIKTQTHFLFCTQETKEKWNFPETFPLIDYCYTDLTARGRKQILAKELSSVRVRETNPKLSPGVPDDPVLSPVLGHTPASHGHDVIGQRQGVELWEETSGVFLQAVGGHQSTTERQEGSFWRPSMKILQISFFLKCFDH